jgi:hypothetical protein
MDKYYGINILPGCGVVLLKTAVHKPFNGWFLMNTPQVSTGGVLHSGCRNNSSKKQLSCNKIAVQFFSLQACYPAYRLDFNVPSKYSL